MVTINISSKKVTLTDALRASVEEKIGSALKVFDIKPMTCDCVLRVGSNASNPENHTCEVTVYVRDYVIRVEAHNRDMYTAIDEVAAKVTRQLRKYKTKVISHHLHAYSHKNASVGQMTRAQMDALLEPLSEEEENNEDDDALVRVKYVDLYPMSEEKALLQTDLLGHDFFVYIDEVTGLTNVVYKRHNGGYGILKPSVELDD